MKNITIGGCKLLTLVLLFLFLGTGCTKDEVYYKKTMLMTRNDYQAVQLMRELKEQYGVQLLVYGNYDKDGAIRLFIKTGSIFNDNSANLNNRAPAIMDKIVALLHCYEEEVVKVKANFKPVDNGVKYSRALALARAQRVVQYLWSQEINATFTYAESTVAPYYDTDYIEIVFNRFRHAFYTPPPT